MEETIIFNECFSEEDNPDCTRLLLPDPTLLDLDGSRDWAKKLK